MIDTYITEEFANRFKELIQEAFPTTNRKVSKLILDVGLTQKWNDVLKQTCKEFGCIDLYHCSDSDDISRYCRFADNVSKQIINML